MSGRPSADQEWLATRVDTWVETYKKSMLTPVILHQVLVRQPVGVGELADAVEAATGWPLTERGLYRTVRRLQDEDLLASTDVDVPRTGVRRKMLSLTTLGLELLSGITGHVLPTAPFADALQDAGAPSPHQRCDRMVDRDRR